MAGGDVVVIIIVVVLVFCYFFMFCRLKAALFHILLFQSRFV